MGDCFHCRQLVHPREEHRPDPEQDWTCKVGEKWELGRRTGWPVFAEELFNVAHYTDSAISRMSSPNKPVFALMPLRGQPSWGMQSGLLEDQHPQSP